MSARLVRWVVLLGAATALLVLLLPPTAAAVTAALAVLLIAVMAHAAQEEPSLVEVTAAASAEPSSPPARAEVLAILDLFAEGVLLLDGEGIVIAANVGAARLLDRPRDGMLGVSLIRAARDHAFVEVLRESAGQPREVILGDQRVIYATATPAESGAIRTVLTLQDLTALRRAERARQELVANVSHELRTPIAAALALAETLESGVDEPAQRERFHRQLTSEIERLSRMVDRLLRLSRLESGVEEFQLDEIDVERLFEEAKRRIAPVAERRHVQIACEVEPGLPLARGDRERVLEVLANLIDNAVRHSPEGGTVMLSGRQDGDAVRFCVRDQGPGIMPQDRARIFERFYTGDRSRGEGLGTGLGLSIARHIVSRHGGRIWVADEIPGAMLCFTIPAVSDIEVDQIDQAAQVDESAGPGT